MVKDHYLNENHDFIGIALSERKEGNVLFNDALNTFYLRLYGKKTCCRQMGYSF